MNSIICRIQPLPSGRQQAIWLSLPLMKEWKCKQGQSIKVRIGGKSLITQVIGYRKKKPGNPYSPVYCHPIESPILRKYSRGLSKPAVKSGTRAGNPDNRLHRFSARSLPDPLFSVPGIPARIQGRSSLFLRFFSGDGRLEQPGDQGMVLPKRFFRTLPLDS